MTSRIRLRPDARLTHLACRWVERAIERGKPSAKTIARIAGQLNGRRIAGGKRLRLSKDGLRQKLWQWRKAGRKPEAWPWRYKPGRGIKLTEVMRRGFAAMCVAPGVTSMLAAWRLFHAKHGEAAPSYSVAARSFTRDQSKAVRELHRMRRRLRALERRAERMVR